MTGPEHFRRAEELAAEAHKLLGQGDGQGTAGLTSPGPGSNPTRNPTRELIAGHDRDHVLFSPQPVGPKKARRKLRSNSKS